MDSPASPVTPAPPQRRRLLFGILAAAAAIAVSAALLIAYGPQLVARQVVRTYLDGLNIDTSGVDTLRMRPLRGELSFGPVTFRGADAEAGRVGRIGVKIDVTRLLRRQALVKAIVIEGVRFIVRQDPDGALSLNGIPLTEILAERAAAAPAPQIEDAPAEEAPAEDAPPAAAPRPITPRTLEEDLGWGAGLDALVIRDSGIVYINARGGEAEMRVHELDLGGFRTWTPDKPGHFRLHAEVNEVVVTASGIAKPFAEKIELETEAAVSGIEVTNIERYLGPLGFTSRAGRIDLGVSRADLILFAAGRLDARLDATGTLAGVDLAHPLFGRGQLAAGTLQLAGISGTYDATGESTLSGDLSVDLQASELRFDDGSEVGFSRVTFGLPGTTIRTAPDRQPALTVAPRLDVSDLRLGGATVRGTIETAAVRLSAFNIEGTEPGAPFLASGSVAVDGIDLVLPDVEPMAIAADRVQVNLAETRLAFPPGRGARIAGGVALDSRRLSLSLQQRAPVAGGPQPPPARFDAAQLSFDMPDLIVDGDGATRMVLTASGPQLSFAEARLGGPDVRGSIGRATFRLASFGMRAAEPGTPLVATGSVAIDDLDLLLPDAGPMAIASGQVRAEMAETRVSLAPGGSRVAGGLALDTRDLLLSIAEPARRGQPPPPPTRIAAGRLSLDLPKVAGDEGGGATVRAAEPRLAFERLRLGGPDIQGTIGSASIRLSAVDVEAAQPGTPVTATGALSAQRLDLLIPDVEPIGIVAEGLDARLLGTRFAFPSGRALIEGAVALDTRDLMLSIYQRGPAGAPPPPPIRIFATNFAGEIPTLVVDDSRAAGTKVTVATPALTLDQFRLDAPVGPAATMQLAAPSLTLRRVAVDVVDAATLEVSGQAGVTAPGLSMILPAAEGGGAAANGHVERLGLDLGHFSYREAGDVTSFGLKGRLGLGALRGRVSPQPAEERPAAGRQAAGRPAVVALSGLTLDVAEAEVTTGGDQTSWRARLDLDLKSAEASLAAPVSLLAGVDDLTLRRFDSASSPATYALETLSIGRFRGSLKREAPSAPARPAPAVETPPAARVWPPADLPAVRIGRFELLDGGTVALLDETVTPPVIATLTVDDVRLDNLDTTDPQAQTQLRATARLGDGSIGVAGWAEPFRARPDLKLRARIDDLPLPTLSPYLAPLTSLDIFKGRLTVNADADATAGQLDAVIRARLAGVRVADRPHAEGDPVSPAIGLPLSTMISLLEDREGAIDVTLPVRGDLLSPEFAVSGVIRSMVLRALRALITSPVRFVSAAAALLAAGGSGSEAAAAQPAPLPPILFTPGTDTVGDDARLALDGLQNLLQEHPTRAVTVCGHATAEDFAALSRAAGAAPDAALRALAAARTEAVTRALTAGGRLPAAQVLPCGEPRADRSDPAPPRVILRL